MKNKITNTDNNNDNIYISLYFMLADHATYFVPQSALQEISFLI